MKKRTIVISLATVLFIGTLTTLFIYNWAQYRQVMAKYEQCDDSWCVRVYGNVHAEVFVNITTLVDGTFPRVENRTYVELNSYNNTQTYNVSGVRLWDILQELKPVLGDYQYFRFEATDGYKTFLIPLRLLDSHPDDFLIITHADGTRLKSLAEDPINGKGPVESAVFLDAIQSDPEIIHTFQDNLPDGFNFVHNSKFRVKWMNGIYLE